MADNPQTKIEKLIKYANDKFGTNESNLRNIIDNAEVGSGGGEYNLESVLLEDGTQKMVATFVGKKTNEYQPNSDMLWARNVLQNDTGPSEHKMLIMTGDFKKEQSIYWTSAVVAFKTSDGGYSTDRANMQHVWDDSKAKVSVNYPQYNKLRYIIIYFNTPILSDYINYVTNGIYICVDNVELTNVWASNSNLFVEYIDFINGGKISDNNLKCGQGFTSLISMTSTNKINRDRAFHDCRNLQFIPDKFDLSNCSTSAPYLFYNCRKLNNVKLINTSHLKDLEYAFYGTGCQYIDIEDTSSVTNMGYCFQNCGSLLGLSHLNTSNVTKMAGCFNGCKLIEKISLSDTSNVTSFQNTFRDNEQLKVIKGLNMSSATNAQAAFSGCKSLEELPEIDASNITTLSEFLYYAGLKRLSIKNTSKVTNFSGCFNGCTSLETVSELNLISATNVGTLFMNCYALTNLTLKNIKITLTIGSGSYYGHLLTLDSLLNTIKELHDNSTGTSTLTLTVGSANLTKLADVYVKLIDITEEMRAEDEFIDLKKPFEVCESTDEGAMLIAEYVTSKNWQIK